jgi:hypothetical protein
MKGFSLTPNSRKDVHGIQAVLLNLVVLALRGRKPPTPQFSNPTPLELFAERPYPLGSLHNFL